MAQRRRRVNKNLIVGLTIAGMLVLSLAGFAGIWALRQRDPEVWREYARTYMDKQDYERATRAYLRAHDISNDPQDLLSAAESLAAYDQPMQAMDLMRRVLTDPSADMEELQTAQRRLVEIQLDLPDFAQRGADFWNRVLVDAEGLLELDPQSPTGYRGKGVACMGLVALDPTYLAQAREALERAMELDPGNVEAARSLWEAYFTDCFQAADPDATRQKAEHLYTSLKNHRPDNAEVESGWGFVCTRFARDLLREAAAQNRGEGESHYTGTELHDLAEQYKAKAKQALDRAVELRPDDAETYSYLASYYLISGDLDSALTSYRKAIEIDPDNLEYYFRLGRLLSLSGRTDEAESVYEAGWKDVKIERAGYRQMINRFYRHTIGCQYAISLMQRASEMNAEQRAELVDQIRKIVEQAVGESRRDTWRSLDVKGRLAALEGNTLEALNLTMQAESECPLNDETGPDKVDLLIRLSRLYRVRKRTGLAEEKMVEALKLRPDVAGLWAELAELRNENQNPEGALDAAAEALRRDSQNLRAKRAQLTAHQMLGHTDEVVRLAKELDTQDTEGKLRQALAYLSDEKSDLAEKLLREAIQSNPTNQKAIELLVLLLLDQERRDEAVQVLQAALQKDPGNIDLAQLLPTLQEEDPAKREELILQVLQKEQDPFRRYLRIARHHVARQEWDLAKAALDQAEQVHPEDSAVIEQQFAIAIASQDWKRAETYAAKAGSLNLDAAQGRFFLGRLSMAQQQFDEAIKRFREGLELSPSDPDAHAWLGTCLLATDHLEQALREFEAAVEISPSHGLANRNLAQIYKQRWSRTREPEDLQKYKDHLEIARASLPRDPWVQRESRLMEEEKKPEEAVVQREKRYETDPNDLENVARLAELHDRVAALATSAAQRLERAGQRDRAEEEKRKAANARQRAVDLLRTAAEANPDVVTLVLDTARYLSRIGRADEAEVFLRQALERATDDTQRAQIYCILGRHFEELENLEEAEANYMQAIEVTKRQDPAVLLDVSSFMRRTKRYHQQAELIAEARDLGGGDPEQQQTLHRKLINLLLQLEDLDWAEREVQKYVEKYPNEAQSLMFRGVMNRLRGRIEQAIADFSKVIERQPTSAIAYWERGRIYFDQSRWDRAISDLEAVKSFAPHGYNYEPRIQLASALFFNHKPDQAISELKSIIEDAGAGVPTLAIVTLVDFYHRLARFDEERQLLIEQNRAKPDDPTWVVMLAQLAQAEHQPTRAVQLLAQAVQMSDNNSRILDLYLNALLQNKQPDEVLAIVAGLPSDKHYPGIEQRLAQAYAQRGQTAEALQQFDQQLHYFVGSLEQLQPAVFNMVRILGGEPVVEHFRQRVADTPPPNFHEQLLLAIALRATNDTQESIALAKQLASATDAEEGQRANALKFLALLMSETGQYDEACRLFEEVLRLRPNDATSLNNLAYTKAERMGQPEEALPYALRALKILPKEANVLDTVGWTCHLANHPLEEAVGYLLRAIRENAELVAAHYHLGEVYLKHNDRAEAEQHLRRALELSQQQNETEFRDAITAALQRIGVVVS